MSITKLELTSKQKQFGWKPKGKLGLEYQTLENGFRYHIEKLPNLRIKITVVNTSNVKTVAVAEKIDAHLLGLNKQLAYLWQNQHV